MFFKYSRFPLAFTFSTIVNKDVLLQYKLELKEITACFIFSQYPENVLNMKSWELFVFMHDQYST